MMLRRGFLQAVPALLSASPPKPLTIHVNLLFDQAAHSGKGLRPEEIAQFQRFQEKARREFAVSGLLFDVRITEGAFVRQQGYTEIPEKFLSRQAINLLVTETLGYDIDRERTGGCSIGPRPRRPGFAPDPFYKTFLGLKDASEHVLPHEYAHHFTLDTRRQPSMMRNSWADLRNDYWLWRQRRGVPIAEFRACAGSEWTS
ncbi:MAG TPA: hypothetical protein VKT81_21280 [Bryobacteraceae bacterium]|nr:hypothetical protein [Bryobacteraceae bacterium]